MHPKRTAIGVLLAGVLQLAGCSGSSSPGPQLDAGPDAGVRPTDAGATVLTGTVHDKAGVPVAGAKVELGSVSGFSDARGRYALIAPPAGAGTLKVTRDWFKPLEESFTLAAGHLTQRDITLEEIPLEVKAADRALADAYNKTFDWTKQALSIVIVPRPTRRDFDNAIYLRNPALYRDTSKETPFTPAPQPEITAGGAQGFTFPVRAGKNQGQEALVASTIADAPKDTPLGPVEPAEFMMWTSMVNWLTEWDAGKTAELKAAGLAVRQQGWGGDVSRPQDIEKAYLDGKGQLWVKVVFESFVRLGAGVGDDDGDGRKEIWAQLAPAHLTPEIVEKLGNEYARTRFSTHGLSKEVAKSLNELYSTTAAQLERQIGQPFEVPGVGTIAHPFMVMRHAGGAKNVVLVDPGP